MAQTGKPGRSRQPESQSPLSEQGHKQIMDYLILADKSQHPDIREMALRLAMQASSYEWRQKARVSPSLILSVSIILALSVATASWYAFLHYPQVLAWELTGICIIVFLVLIAILLFVAGRLSEKHLMAIFQWLWFYIRARFKSLKPSPDSMDENATSNDA